MIDQLSLPYSEPTTSKAAAESMREPAGRMLGRILDLLIAHGPLTCDEVEQLTGYRHQTASARLNELERQRWVIRLEATRRTRSGRQARLYQARAA